MAEFDKAIAPGQEGKITLRLNTASQRGLFSKSAVVHSNDPKQPTTNIGINCVVKPYIVVNPSEWIKLEGFEGDTISKSVTIASLEEQPFTIEGVTCKSRDTCKIKYELTTIKEGQEYGLKIENLQDSAGSFGENIELKTNSQKKPIIVVNVYSNLRPRVTVQPKMIAFGTIDRKNPGEQKMQRNVVIIDHKSDVLTIKKCTSSKKWISAKVEQQEQRGKCIVVIALDSTKAPIGTFEEQVSIYTSFRKQPYVVGIKGSVL